MTAVLHHDADDEPLPTTPVLLTRPLVPETEHATLSRFRDDRWNLTPALFDAHATTVSLNFTSIHLDFRDSLKRLMWAMLNRSDEQTVVNNHQPGTPAVRTVARTFRFVRAFTNWLTAHGRTSFAEVTATDLDDYLVDVKNAEVPHAHREDLLAAVTKIWAYRRQLPESERLPPTPPWNAERPHRLLEHCRRQEITTPRIHPDTMNRLLAWSMRFVDDFAGDIVAAFHEYERIHQRALPTRRRCRRKPGELTDDLHRLLGTYRRLGYSLPGVRGADGRITYHFRYLARLLDTAPDGLRHPDKTAILDRCGIPIRAGAALLVPITGTLDGAPWRLEPIDEQHARSLARMLTAACFVVIGDLSGMRTGEILTLERGCLRRGLASGLLLLTGRQWKNAHLPDGSTDPQGQIRPDPWVVAEPVAAAIEVLEALHPNELLFPNMLGRRTTVTDAAARQFRDGKARTSGAMAIDIAELIAWIDTYCRHYHRTDSVPPDPVDPAITGRRLRRTLAWFIARRPRGLVAAAIQYGHLQVQMTLGYAGTYASGFPDDLAFEQWLARLDHLADAHHRLADGEHVSGSAAATYRHRVVAAQRFAGHTLRTNREARAMLANPDLQIYSGAGMTCVFDADRAACRISSDQASTLHTPDLTDCRPTCGNIARTDRDIAHLTAAVERLRALVADPLSPPLRTARERAELHRLDTIITRHHQTRGN